MKPVEVLSDVTLPERVIAAGVRGRVMRKNTRVQVVNGALSVNVQWDYSLREFEIGYIPMLPGAWQELRGVFEVTDAGAYGFLLPDPTDSTVSASEGKLLSYLGGVAVGSVGSGYGVPVSYMLKRYTAISGTRFRDRPVSRPVLPTVRRNGTPVVVGPAPGNVSIDTAIGKVTFVADVQQDIQSITPGASTVFTFADDTGMFAAMSVGERVFISGVSGTAASVLNGRSHLVTGKSGVTLTVSTTTAGLTATGGTALKYPQESDALTWSGAFVLPVQFANDTLDWELLKGGPEDGRLIAGPSVTLVEILELPT